MRKYTLRVKKQRVEVTEEIYKGYYKEVEIEKYQIKKDEINGVVSYNALDTDDFCGEEIIHDKNAMSCEDKAIENVMIENLRPILTQLSEKEFDLIQKIYFDNISMREIARNLGVKHPYIVRQHKVILKKLKKLLEN